jgi:hypothetical protein
MMFKALVAGAGNEYPLQPSEAHLFVFLTVIDVNSLTSVGLSDANANPAYCYYHCQRITVTLARAITDLQRLYWVCKCAHLHGHAKGPTSISTQSIENILVLTSVGVT